MKLCDRCFLHGDHKAGPHVLTVGVEEYDLCESCKEYIREQITNPQPVKKAAKKRAAKRKPKAAEQEN